MVPAVCVYVPPTDRVLPSPTVIFPALLRLAEVASTCPLSNDSDPKVAFAAQASEGIGAGRRVQHLRRAARESNLGIVRDHRRPHSKRPSHGVGSTGERADARKIIKQSIDVESVLPLFTVTFPLFVKPARVRHDQQRAGLVCQDRSIIDDRHGVGVADRAGSPELLLWLVNALPEPKMQVVEIIVSLPEPMSVAGLFNIMQLCAVRAMVPVLFTVPSRKRYRRCWHRVFLHWSECSPFRRGFHSGSESFPFR